MSKEKFNIAVYGSLRNGLHNHSLIKDEKFLGMFETTPAFEMYSLGSYPGLKTDGSTPILMEVYEVDADTLESVDALEGYSENSEHNNFYDRIKISTPFGDAYTYIYVPSVTDADRVESGDWAEYYQTSKVN